MRGNDFEQSQLWHYCRAGAKHEARAAGPTLQKVLQPLEKLKCWLLIIMKAWRIKRTFAYMKCYPHTQIFALPVVGWLSCSPASQGQWDTWGWVLASKDHFSWSPSGRLWAPVSFPAPRSTPAECCPPQKSAPGHIYRTHANKPRLQ